VASSSQKKMVSPSASEKHHDEGQIQARPAKLFRVFIPPRRSFAISTVSMVCMVFQSIRGKRFSIFGWKDYVDHVDLCMVSMVFRVFKRKLFSIFG